MYIRSLNIERIRSIDQFTMSFEEGKEAGWHVILGANGAGKSTIVRSLAAVLTGPEEIGQVRPYWEEWLQHGQTDGNIRIELSFQKEFDSIGPTRPPKKPIINEFQLTRNGKVSLSSNADAKTLRPSTFNWGNNAGWFSAAYGPFRRFTGGNKDWDKLFFSAPKAGAHLSVFGEDVALTEALEWLKDLDRKRLKEKESSPSESESEYIFNNVKAFLNGSGLLPHSAILESVNIDGDPVFTDGNGRTVKVIQLSDGYRSILSLTFELLRQLIRSFGAYRVFSNDGPIKVPGVVIIDEVDAHLHPSWQTEIGAWFTTNFPNIQFIVTTHSPLVCRAAEKGSIWHLSAPGSTEPSGKVSDLVYNRLINGNILDAYGTEVFGRNTSRSETGNRKMRRLAELNALSITGDIGAEQEKELAQLQMLFPSGK